MRKGRKKNSIKYLFGSEDPIKPKVFKQSNTYATSATEDSLISRLNDYEDLPHNEQVRIDDMNKEKEPILNRSQVKDLLVGALGILPDILEGRDEYPTVEPQEGYNPNPRGTGSQAISKAGASLSPKKARKILRDGTVHGKSLTDKQKRYFGWVAGGSKAEAGEMIDPPTKEEQYYQSSARLSHFKGLLNEKLKAKNPQAYGDYFKGLSDIRRKRDTAGESSYVQDTPYNEYLSPEEVRGTLGDEDYNAYLQSIRDVNAYNVAQGQMPLYGTKEDGSEELSSLNYGRRFASLKVTPTVSVSNTENTKRYKRDYTYDPTSKQVGFKEEGNLELRPSYVSAPEIRYKAGGVMKSSNNYYDGGTMEFSGPSHKEGGMDISYGGKTVEVEGGETAFKDTQGNLNIMGNMYVPGTNMKFKTASKKLARKEQKYTGILEDAVENANTHGKVDKFTKLKSATAAVMMEGANIAMHKVSTQKEFLAQLQSHMLDIADESGIDPIAMSEGKVKKAKCGAKVQAKSGNWIQKAINPEHKGYCTPMTKSTCTPRRKALARRFKSGDLHNGEAGGKIIAQAGARLNDDAFTKYLKSAIGKAESDESYFVKAKGGSSAYGKYQFTKDTRKGVWERHFKDVYKTFEDFDEKYTTSKDLQEDVMSNHVADLRKQYGDDPEAIALVHRLGPGGYKKVKANPKLLDKPVYTSVPQSKDKETPRQYLDKIVGKKAPQIDKEQSKVAPIDTRVTIPPTVSQNRKPPKYSDPGYPETELGDLTYTKKDLPSAADFNRLSFGDVAPEIFAIVSSKVDPVPAQKYMPQLFEPYSVSFQDRLNENQSTFNAIARSAAYNPAALGTAAAQKYAADNQVLGEEFRTNQGIGNEIINKNIALQNDAQLKNLSIADQQMVRQSTARSKTRSQLFEAINSLQLKEQLNRLENVRIRTYEPLFDYRYGDKNNDGVIDNFEYAGQDPNFNYGSAPQPSGAGEHTRTKEIYSGQGDLKQYQRTTPSPVIQEREELQNQRLRDQVLNDFMRTFPRITAPNKRKR